MNTPQKQGFPWLTVLLALHAAVAYGATTQLMPGLTCYDAPKQVAGRFVFLASSIEADTKGVIGPVAFYELDLRSKLIRKITDVPRGVAQFPRGFLVASKAGTGFAVIYGEDPVTHDVGTNLFAYSDALHRGSQASLQQAPAETVVVGNHVLLRTDAAHIWDYDLNRDEPQLRELAGLDQFGKGRFSALHGDPDTTMNVHFRYDTGSNQNAKSGVYSYDVETQKMVWIGDGDKDRFSFRSADGRFILFKGPSAPVHGNVLVSVASNDLKGNNGADVKVLANFSKPRAPGDDCCLDQLSPSKEYALIRCAEQVIKKSGDPGWSHVYYCINIFTGEKSLILKDEVDQKSSGFMSQRVFWLPGADKP